MIALFGGSGLVGSNLIDCIGKMFAPRSSEVNLLDRSAIKNFFDSNPIDTVIMAAGTVGGIVDNNARPYDFISDNLEMGFNVIREAAMNENIVRVLYLGSSCIYPKECPQPMKEEYLLTGQLEQTNYAYAVAKIACHTICRAWNQQFGTRKFKTLMPTNLYGPYDTFDERRSHVIPALIKKFHDAKMENKLVVKLLGDGSPLREFLYAHDLARGVLLTLYCWETLPDMINIGSGDEISIRDLAQLVSDVVGYKGEIKFDKDQKMNGTSRKLVDSSFIRSIGWTPQIDIVTGLKVTYKWFRNKQGME